MILKRYAEVKPGAYDGLPRGVDVREMITEEDGAPHFALRVFDLSPGAATPFHDHAWEHEVYILQGTGRVRTEQGEVSFRKGDSVFIPGHERHGFVADADQAVQFVCVIPSKRQCTL